MLVFYMCNYAMRINGRRTGKGAHCAVWCGLKNAREEKEARSEEGGKKNLSRR